MKIVFFSLLFSAFSLFSTAQVFNEKTFMDIMDKGLKDPVTYLKNETAPDFQFLGTGGFVIDLKTFIGLNENNTSVNRKYTNLKVRQYGNTGIATGILNHTIEPKKGGEGRTETVLFTYVFAEKAGKWQLVSWHHSEGPTDVKQEEAAIKAVIEKETQAFIERDAAAMIASHANKPYSMMLVSESGNVHYNTNANMDMGKSITAMIAGMGKPANETFKNSDYVIKITDNTAFAYFDQSVKTTDSAEPQLFHEVRHLEKINGLWKIVYVGAVRFK